MLTAATQSKLALLLSATMLLASSYIAAIAPLSIIGNDGVTKLQEACDRTVGCGAVRTTFGWSWDHGSNVLVSFDLSAKLGAKTKLELSTFALKTVPKPGAVQIVFKETEITSSKAARK